MEEALVLTKYSPRVTMVHRRDAFKASQAMQQRVLNNERITIIWDTEVVEMMGEPVLDSVKLKTKADGKQGKILKERLGDYKGEILEESQGSIISVESDAERVVMGDGRFPRT